MARPSFTVQALAPFGTLTPRRLIHLYHEKIAPLVRIAHRQTGRMAIARRIIFDHELVLVESGSVTLITDESQQPIHSGHCVLIQPFVPHAFDSDAQSVTHVAVHFDYSMDSPAVDARHGRRLPYEVQLPADLAAPAHLPLRVGDFGHRLFGDLLRAWAIDGERSNLAARGVLLQLIVELASASTPQPPQDRSSAANRLRIERALAYIEAHLVDPPSVAQLADVAGLSESHFARLFRRHAGASVIDHITRRRVQVARELLGNVDLSIKQIAARCGFEDAYYFSRVFRRVDGLSPSQYRQALLAGPGK